jgi:hypothetical protein
MLMFLSQSNKGKQSTLTIYNRTYARQLSHPLGPDCLVILVWIIGIGVGRSSVSVSKNLQDIAKTCDNQCN